MAPLYDTDLAAERWAKDEWRTAEFYEKVRAAQIHRRRLWILATSVLCVLLSGVPVVWDRTPKWDTLAAARFLATEIRDLRKEASLKHMALRLRFDEKSTGLVYLIESVRQCSGQSDSANSTGTLVRQGVLLPEAKSGQYQILKKEDAKRLGLERVVHVHCYDPLELQQPSSPDPQAIAIAPVQDLSVDRLDRLSFVLLQDDGDIGFN